MYIDVYKINKNAALQLFYRHLSAIAVPMCLIFALLWMSSLNLHPDNVAVRYGDLLDNREQPSGQLSNYRYVIALIDYVMWAMSIPYFSLLVVWIGIFVASLVWLVFEFLLFISLPVTFLPLAFSAIALHAYFSDVYQFAMSFNSFALSFAGVAAALFFIRKLKKPICISLASAAMLFALASYQPFALILLTAVILSIISKWLKSHKLTTRDLVPEGYAVASFALSVVAFLLLKSAIDSGDGSRDISFSYLFINFSEYFKYILSPLLYPGSLTKLLPLHERFIYWAITIFLFIILIFCIVRWRSSSGAVAMGAFICALLLAPDPFNLLGKELWITPRTMVHMVFFQVGVAAILFDLAPRGWRPALLLSAVLLIAASAVNQIILYRAVQYQRDVDISYVNSITEAIKTTYNLPVAPMLAVKSDWRSAPQIPEAAHMDFGLSAFAKPWSNSRVFRLESGIPFVSVRPPQGACVSKPATLWHIEKIGNIVVVCMR